jgi:hypothetical protein
VGAGAVSRRDVTAQSAAVTSLFAESLFERQKLQILE